MAIYCVFLLYISQRIIKEKFLGKILSLKIFKGKKWPLTHYCLVMSTPISHYKLASVLKIKKKLYENDADTENRIIVVFVIGTNVKGDFFRTKKLIAKKRSIYIHL